MRLFAAAALVLATNTAVAMQAGPDRPEKTADTADKIVCKRFVETGSLVKSYRTCKTKGEWQRERDGLRALGASTSCRATGAGGSC